MNRPCRVVKAPDGRVAPLCRVKSADRVGSAIRPGVIVEVDRETADACGAWSDDCLTAAEAFEAAEDPADFGEGGGRDNGPI